MKNYLLLITALCLSNYVISQSRAEMGVGALGLVVSDIEASEAFYKDILGMVEVGGFSLDEQWSQEAGAANNEPFSVKQFKQKDVPTALTIKLAYFDTEVKAADPQGLNAHSGVNYITLYYNMDDFHAIIDRAKAANIPLVGWVKRERYQLVFIKDPNGVYVEVIGPPEE